MQQQQKKKNPVQTKIKIMERLNRNHRFFDGGAAAAPAAPSAQPKTDRFAPHRKSTQVSSSRFLSSSRQTEERNPKSKLTFSRRTFGMWADAAPASFTQNLVLHILRSSCAFVTCHCHCMSQLMRKSIIQRANDDYHCYERYPRKYMIAHLLFLTTSGTTTEWVGKFGTNQKVFRFQICFQWLIW